MVTAINAVVGTVCRRRLDSIGLLVVAEITLWSEGLIATISGPPPSSVPFAE
jgi:hypothetical protein